MQTGIYANLSNDEYHNIPAISNSKMGKLLRNPIDFWHEFIDPQIAIKNSWEHRVASFLKDIACLKRDLEDNEIECLVDNLGIGQDLWRMWYKSTLTGESIFKNPAIEITAQNSYVKEFAQFIEQKAIKTKRNPIIDSLSAMCDLDQVKSKKRSKDHFKPLKTQKAYKKSSVAYQQGTVIHQLFTEPHNFNYKVKPGIKSSSQIDTIGELDLKCYQTIANEMRQDSFACNFFVNGSPEVSIFWIDEKTGLPCKCRLDYLNIYIFVAVEIKSIERRNNKECPLTNESIKQIIRSFDYHRQAAFYLEGLRQVQKALIAGNAVIHGFDDAWKEQFCAKLFEHYVFFFVKKEEPFDYRTLTLDSEFMELGREQFREALNVYKYHIETYGTNKWPSIHKREVQVLSLTN